jgi:serine/threonine-protein kinase
MDVDPTSDDAGVSMFGPYRVLREIGSGGMGAVYLAERSDEQYRKEVALKVLPRWSGGDRRRLQRFLEERQILARLDHPGIARLLDGGVTSDGQPWFAMEYIDGQPIDKYCDELRMSVEKRLELFCVACSAVQYAHRNLVVHRDLKPSNILVSVEGRVALLDFGIAKLLAEDSTIADPAKTVGDRLMTPLYASPEQIRGEPASTSADIYALGVLLHVLLTGSRPYRLSTFESYEVARAVLEQEPERPSVSAARDRESVGAGAAEPSAAARALSRGSTPVKLIRQLRGDLDAIVLKAMAKDPGRRYSTVEQLETDLRRHLTGLPVLAQPDSRSYLVRKFVHRHRAGVAMASAAAVLVVGFAAVMTVQRSRIRKQAERIALERDRAEQVSKNFMSIFQTIAPAERGLLVRDILDSAAARIDTQMIDHPEPRARLMFDMAGAYHRLELYDRARGLLETSLVLRRNLSPRPALDIAETLNLLGAVLLAQDSVARSEQAYDEALQLRRQELGPRHADIARTLVGLSAVRRAQRRFPEAERLAHEAVAIDRSRGRDGRADLARSTSALAGALEAKGDHSAAVALFREALALMRETHLEEHGEVAVTVLDLAGALYSAGDKRSADSLVRYGIALNRRLLTGGVLSGTVSIQLLPNSDRIANVNETVRRAFAETPTPSQAASTGASANSSQIAFTSDRDEPDATGNFGNEEIYIMNADGTNQRRLTRHRARDTGASISPDGRKIAFQSQREGGVDIFVMNADGSDPRRLTDFTQLGLGAVDPTWSPDGKRIAFRSRVNRIDIYVINLDGTGLEKLTSDSSVVSGSPDWSPDGRRIAYVSRRHGRPEIYVMNSDGSHQTRLTFNDSADTRPAWSPDGRQIAFYSNRDGDQEIYVMNADGSNQVRLTTNPGEDGFPSWSPDGRRIVFHRRVLGHGQVFTMNADGSDVKRRTELSPVAFSGFPNWGRAPR